MIYEQKDGVYEFEIEHVEKIEELRRTRRWDFDYCWSIKLFPWCIRENIIDYVFNNIKDIEKDMLDSVNKRNKNNKEFKVKKVLVKGK